MMPILAMLLPLALQATAPAGQIRLPLSPAGQAVAKRWLGSPDPQVVALQQQIRAAAQRMRTLAAAPKLDLGQVGVLVRQQQGLQTALRKRSDDRMLAMLAQMSEADRLAFVRAMMAGPQPSGAAPR